MPLAVITMILQMRRVLRKRAGEPFHPDDVQHNLTLRELTVREKLESHGWL